MLLSLYLLALLPLCCIKRCEILCGLEMLVFQELFSLPKKLLNMCIHKRHGAYKLRWNPSVFFCRSRIRVALRWAVSGSEAEHPVDSSPSLFFGKDMEGKMRREGTILAASPVSFLAFMEPRNMRSPCYRPAENTIFAYSLSTSAPSTLRVYIFVYMYVRVCACVFLCPCLCSCLRVPVCVCVCASV